MTLDRGAFRLTLKETGDFDDTDCYGVCSDFEKMRVWGNLEFRKK